MHNTQSPSIPLGNKLNPQQLSVFMRKILPELDRDYAMLDTLLQNRQWEEAARQAHKLLSVVKLLGLEALLPLLQQIEAADPESQTKAFRSTLTHTYRQQLAALSALTLPPPA
ncbi:MAG: hypothetical protein R3E93_04885 [Thiothrix sp.]